MNYTVYLGMFIFYMQTEIEYVPLVQEALVVHASKHKQINRHAIDRCATNNGYQRRRQGVDCGGHILPILPEGVPDADPMRLEPSRE